MKRQPWQRKENWIAAAKALVTMVPVAIIYSIFGTRVLIAFCAWSKSEFLCTFGFIVYVAGIVGIVRIFFVWLRPTAETAEAHVNDGRSQ